MDESPVNFEFLVNNEYLLSGILLTLDSTSHRRYAFRIRNEELKNWLPDLRTALGI